MCVCVCVCVGLKDAVIIFTTVRERESERAKGRAKERECVCVRARACVRERYLTSEFCWHHLNPKKERQREKRAGDKVCVRVWQRDISLLYAAGMNFCAQKRETERKSASENERVCACVRARQLFTLVRERAYEQEREIVCVRVCVRDLAADSIIFTTVRVRESEWSRKQMCVGVRAAQISLLLASPLQGGEDALSRGSLSAN